MRTKTRVLYGLVVAAALIGATAAHAAVGCRDVGRADAGSTSFDTNDKDLLAGMETALRLGLEPASFPADKISKNHSACRRGQFEAAGVKYTLYGDDDDSPPRWASDAGHKHIVYLALIPDPLEAKQWADRRESDPATPATFTKRMFVLTVGNGAKRLVYDFSRKISDDYHLVQDMRAAIEGIWKPLATIDLSTGSVDLSNLLEAGPRPVVKDPQDSKTFAAPDGEFFVPDGQGGGRHVPSGLRCPVAYGAFNRENLVVLNPESGGLDVYCRYFEEKGWFSVFATKYADQSLAAIFESYKADAQKSTPPVRSLPPPGPIKSAFELQHLSWVGAEGLSQSLWVTRRGDWYYEIRATYDASVKDDVAISAQQVVDSIPAAPGDVVPEESQVATLTDEGAQAAGRP